MVPVRTSTSTTFVEANQYNPVFNHVDSSTYPT